MFLKFLNIFSDLFVLKCLDHFTIHIKTKKELLKKITMFIFTQFPIYCIDPFISRFTTYLCPLFLIFLLNKEVEWSTI